MHELARGWSVSAGQAVVDRGLDLSLADVYGRTPLHLACAVNHPSMANWLIEHAPRHVKKVGVPDFRN